jgi:hypothetical protein
MDEGLKTAQASPSYAFSIPWLGRPRHDSDPPTLKDRKITFDRISIRTAAVVIGLTRSLEAPARRASDTDLLERSSLSADHQPEFPASSSRL